MRTIDTATDATGRPIGAGSACNSIVITPLSYSGFMFVNPKLMTRYPGLGSQQAMNVLAGKTRVIVAISMSPLLLLTACSHATKAVPPPIALGFCGSNPQVMPGVVLVVCNTDDITARNLIWSDWGKPTATAKGSATVDLCAYEDCASGDYASVPIEMTASKIVHCSKNTRAYSTLRYLFPNGSPFQGVPAIVKTSGSFGQDQPAPPADQTVSLTC